MSNSLNDSDIDGNTMNNFVYTDGVAHEDRYLCRICSSLVLERKWNSGLKCCFECASEVTNYGAF